MHIVADANLALLEETFGQHASISTVPGRDMRAEHVRNADVLLLRSVTRANRELLGDSPVKFVGTATIGTDHLDIPFLEDRGICWASAPGCNANAAAQYTLAMAWLAANRLGKDLRDLSVGIIGRGNVGSRLQNLLDILHIPSVACDPPLADAGETGLVKQAQAFRQPVISFHVPLTSDGPYPTFHMLNGETLSSLSDGTMVVNASRGDVIDGNALLKDIRRQRVAAALDVWPHEPGLDLELMDSTVVASPHVAGYSMQGKQNGTLMIYRAFCDWAGIETATAGRAEQHFQQLHLDPAADVIRQVLNASCGVEQDDQTMRQSLSETGCDVAVAFDQLRKTYRLRNDFGAWEVSGHSPGQESVLSAMGFRLAN